MYENVETLKNTNNEIEISILFLYKPILNIHCYSKVYWKCLA